MVSAVEITGIPTKAKAKEVAATMKAFFPTWTVQIIGTAAPYTVRRTPPAGAAGAAAVPVAAGGGNAGGAGGGSGGGAAAAGPNVGVAGDRRDGAYGFLDFIAKYESVGNYNAFYAHANNTDDPRFTSMTIDRVLGWQKGRKFSACGKYQIIRATLKDLKAQLGLTGAELYDPERQDTLGFTLLQRRGLNEFLAGTMGKEDFALSVAREWAALPGVKPPFGERSVYAGVGANHAMVDSKTYLKAIAALKESHKAAAPALGSNN